jgi:hypothetical protein
MRRWLQVVAMSSVVTLAFAIPAVAQEGDGNENAPERATLQVTNQVQHHSGVAEGVGEGVGDLDRDRIRLQDKDCTVDCDQDRDRIRLQDKDCTVDCDQDRDQIRDRVRTDVDGEHPNEDGFMRRWCRWFSWNHLQLV